jgi:hypothetical protein
MIALAGLAFFTGIVCGLNLRSRRRKFAAARL